MIHREQGNVRAAGAGKPPGNRERILETTLRLFTTQGIDATPTAQISREANVSTGTLFHYFPDKNNLADQLYLSVKKDLAEAIRQHDDGTLPTRQRLGQCLRGYLDWGMENQEKVKFLNMVYSSPGVSDEVRRRAHEDFTWMSDLTGAAVREGLLPDLPCEFYFVMLSQVLNGILILISSGSFGMTREQIIENGLAMMWMK